jgi:hypothetical protein
VGPRTGLDDMENTKVLILRGLELRPLGRLTRSQSLYRLRYPGNCDKPKLNIFSLALLSELPGSTQRPVQWILGKVGGGGGSCPCGDLNLTTPSSVDVSNVQNSIPTIHLGIQLINLPPSPL